MTKSGAGRLTLSGSNTHSGGTTVSAGTLAGNSASLQGNIANNAAVEFTQSSDGTYAGNMSGNGALTKTGAGRLTLSGSNIHSGGTTVSAGTLAGNTSNLQGNIANNAAVEFTQSSDGTYAGNMSGNGALTKSGAGRLILSGSNTHSGGTTVSAGTLAGSTSNLQGNIANNAAVEFTQSSDGTYAGNMSGNGALTKSGAGRLTLSGSNTHSGGTTVSAGTLAVSTSNLQGNISNNAAVEFSQASDGIYAGNMSGSGTLTKTGAGRLTLSGSNSYGGGTTVSAGTLTGDTASLKGSITNNAAVAFEQTGNGTYAGDMSGSGALTKSGVGRLTLSGSNSYGGGTTVSAGTLAGDTASLNGSITNNAAVEFEQTGNGTYAGNMSGSGAMTKTGAGTLTLSGNNSTFSGATSVNAGSLVLNGTTASNLLISTGAGFGGNGTVARLENRGTVAPGNSIGTTTVTGDYVHDASATYEVEINNYGQSDLIDVSGTATINGGTLDVQPEAGTYTPGTRYTILDADGGVTGEFDTLTGSVIGSRLQLFYNANNIELFLAPLYYATARTPNQKAVAAMLEQMSLDPTGDVGSVLSQLDTVINTPGGEAYFDQLGGEVFGTTASVGIESTGLLLKTIGGRLRTMAAFEAARNVPAVRTYTAGTLEDFDDTIIRGQASSQPCCGWRPWVQGYGVSSNAKGDGNASGFNYSIGGATVAVDRALDRYTRLGIAGGYGASRINLDGPAQRAYV
ncbi:MAG: autotransporter-associated beta strand repeat-containing protein, partial [Planctomycetota bacterium]|nr:autotransporter-associated beta strand repeat-containing protein [Planctomycetota bacterium]